MATTARNTRRSAPPGKASASEPPDWTTLQAVEDGGFAGLRRGATLVAAELPAPQRKRLGRMIEQARQQPPARPDYPDAQTFELRVDRPDGSWLATFDTADLPPGVDELRAELTFKPLQR